MKKKSLFMLAFVALGSVAANAQESSTISEECLINISLFNESAKNKQYADAAGPWLKAYTECPSANKAIYSHGRNILVWQLSQTKDPKEIDVLRNRLMEMYDKRIQYFGDDSKYPTPWILGRKALDYIVYFPEDQLKENAYQWLETAVDGLKTEADVAVLTQFVALSANIYKAKPETAEKFISDYLKAGAYLDAIASNPSDRYAASAAQQKQVLDAMFVQSGVADCNTLDNIYKDKVAANISNFEVLSKIVEFYEQMDCKESEVYFAASTAAHKISPTAKSASGCAAMCYKNKNFEEAIKYFEEAVTLAEDNKDKSNYEYMIAYIYYSELKNYPTARSHARKASEYDPTTGKPYILVAHMYAGSQPYDDPILNKTVYWVAVDELRRAKQVDPSCAEEADKYINMYSRHFPNTEEIFFHADLGEGKPYTVGGWIGVTTTCR